MFSGLIYCADCGKKMLFHRVVYKNYFINYFACRTYKKRGKEICSGHIVQEKDLYQIILEEIKRVTKFALTKEKEFAAIIQQQGNAESKKELVQKQKELDRAKHRCAELNSIFKRLYEDNVLGRIPNEQYRILSSNYIEEQKQLEENILNFDKEIENLKATVVNIDRFIMQAKRFTFITELTPEILNTFITKVVVHERGARYSRKSEQKIDIYFSHIGIPQFSC